MIRLAAVLAALLLLGGCSAPSVSVGSKPFAENRILAEMFAILLSDEGLRVHRRFPTGETEEVFAALQAGAIDVYPEYTGTVLGLMGLPSMARPDAAWSEVLAALQRSDLLFLPRLGYQSRYAVLTTAEVAAARGLEAVEDLVDHAPRMTLGVAETWAKRPRDGLGPFLDRFGLDFAAVETSEGSTRDALYAGLLEGRFDVMIGFATDPQIADYGLVELAPRQPFFPAYEAAPLASRAALERAPRIRAALLRLAGRLDLAMMQRLIEAVEREGRAPRQVAAEALADLGLIDVEDARAPAAFYIAAEDGTLGGRAENRALRAVRRALPQRGVALIETPQPAAAIRRRLARLALAPSIAQFHVRAGAAERDETLEAVAAVGSTMLHAVLAPDRVAGLAMADTIATGPFGSASYKMASVWAARRDPPARVLARAGAPEAAAAVAAGEADAMLILAAPGRPRIAESLRAHPELRLAEAAGWWRGYARIALPFLNEAVIPAGTYPGQAEPVETLAMQLTLIGPAPPRRSLVGRQGPGVYTDALLPLTDDAVLAINAELGPHPSVDPAVRRAAALAPRVRGAGEWLNPSPDQAILSLAILVFMLWAGWLLIRA